MYRHQRHIYDMTRKFYLLGRDELIATLDPPAGGSVLEVGCGTGRNLIKMAQTYPAARFYGLDISHEMLVTARASIARAGLAERITLAQADATTFDPQALFGRPQFDRVAISYALSMIPPWHDVLRHAAQTVAPGGVLLVVDFGDQAGLPPAFKRVLDRWLALFHVTPRLTLARDVAALGDELQMKASSRPRFRGYAIEARMERPA
ncbi:class I SAM-dependent methyltransferase [Beijerinckia sp. L45]|uniref:class I SAM-dependent methyltransferase n=1 Tax=Beijerinckia sp. L45 TaxID=1641855 RepID=UPI00131C046A|nr:class I SAM-dependent methyltransferase [Beijerinckia sp. L45]